MRGEELPDGLSLPDQMAYTALRNTYRAYYDKTISRDAAAAEKQQQPSRMGTSRQQSSV